MQLTELTERCSKLQNQCKAKHAAGERNKALANFNDKYNSVSFTVAETCVLYFFRKFTQYIDYGYNHTSNSLKELIGC